MDTERFTRPVTTLPGALPPAGFWIRFVAALIDLLILMVLTIPFTLGVETMGSVFNLGSNDTTSIIVITVVNCILNLLILWLYCGWFSFHRGATPGKLFCGLEVVDQFTGKYLSYFQSFRREILGKLASAIPLGGGFFMAGLRKDKRGLHDFVAKTKVVRRVE